MTISFQVSLTTTNPLGFCLYVWVSFYSLYAGVAYMHKWTGSSLSKVFDEHLLCTRPLSISMASIYLYVDGVVGILWYRSSNEYQNTKPYSLKTFQLKLRYNLKSKTRYEDVNVIVFVNCSNITTGVVYTYFRYAILNGYTSMKVIIINIHDDCSVAMLCKIYQHACWKETECF